jgi:hypothetical protein
MGLGLRDAVSSDVVTVRAIGGARAGGPVRISGGAARVGSVGGGAARVGSGGVAGGGPYVGDGRWAGGPRWGRPGYGVAAGALVGGAIAAGSYDNGYGYGGYNGYDYGPGYANYYAPDYTNYGYNTSGSADAAYCAQRFKSYDPSSGTYLGYDGQRHPCP